ncbi:uncharacterized protein LOC110080488 isoform X1 [Pogona vitticeps]
MRLPCPGRVLRGLPGETSKESSAQKRGWVGGVVFLNYVLYFLSFPALLEESKVKPPATCRSGSSFPAPASLPPPSVFFGPGTMGFFMWRLRWVIFLSWLQALRGAGFLIKNARLEKCLHASSHEAEKVGLADCKPHSPYYQWRWEAAARTVVNQKTGECLAVSDPQEFALAQLETCGEAAGTHQAWVCSRKGHLTLPGYGLHLSMKPGGHKAFLSREKDKFSRWKTAEEGTVCAAELHPGNAGLGDPAVESRDALVWIPERIHPLSIDTTSTPPTTLWEDGANGTSIFPTNEGTSREEDQERDTLQEKHERKAVGSQHSGTGWVTVMLVLSPLAFILGVIILLLNIHHNKKKKQLSALKSRQVILEERRPLPGPPGAGPPKRNAPAPASPSLRHGEILIEWKDGTVTLLFDSMNYSIC